MQVTDYFVFEKFEKSDRIRIKGSRIAIDHVLAPYQEGISPEEIVNRYYPSLTLEQVYATITYYLQNKQDVDAYLLRGIEYEEALYQEYLKQEPPEVVKRLRAIKAKQEAKAQQGNRCEQT